MDQPRTLSRRKFAALTAAAAGSVAAGNTASATTRSETTATVDTHTTDLYRFLLEQVERDFTIPTMVQFTDESGYETLEERDLAYRVHPGEKPVAHAELTPADARSVLDATSTELLEYAPGANPFWKLGTYQSRVFPPPEESVGHISLAEARAGVTHLEKTHPDRLNVVELGESHGFENRYKDENDPEKAWALELTDQTTGSFETKEKLVFTMSVHGDERAGTEASLRFVESVLEGGHPEIADLLSEFVLVFLNPNPDGWVVHERVYEDPVNPPDFTRHNGAVRDLNREQPTTGYISPTHLPAEPNGTLPDAEDDPPAEVTEKVPETLAMVEHLRSYESVEYLVDFHGMFGSDRAVLGLGNGGGTLDEHAEQTLWFDRIEEKLANSVGPLSDWESAFERAKTDMNDQIGRSNGFQTPNSMFAYGTAGDTISYTASGVIDHWARLPESQGGLGATAITTEIVFSNSARQGMANRFLPELTAFHVAAYQAVCEATIGLASDTVETTVETGGRRSAYVDTDSLTRRATDLSHVDDDSSSEGSPSPRLQSGGSSPARYEQPSGSEQPQRVWSERTQFSQEEMSKETTVTVPESTHTLDVRVTAGRETRINLLNPGGITSNPQQKRARAAQKRDGCCRFTVRDPEPGEWTIETVGQQRVDIQATYLTATQELEPDPAEVLGYEQRDYEVSPLECLDSLADTESLTVEEIRDGALLAGEYDNLVVCHEDGIDPAYLDALEAFVERGGNLVLTDAGVSLATELDIDGLDSVSAVDKTQLRFANYRGIDSRDQSHPLLTDTIAFGSESSDLRPILQTEPWQRTAMGYAPGEIPAYEVRKSGPADSLDIGMQTETGGVRLGTVSTVRERIGVHVLGTLLAPASQQNLHPFGLADHGLTFFGYQLLCNSLGYEILVTRNDWVVTPYGSTVDHTVSPSTDNETESESSDTESDTDDTTVEPEDTDTKTAPTPSDQTAPDTESDEETREATETADDDGAGFGAGLATLGGLGYLLGQRLGEDSDPED